jgi:hypothetical protein
MSGQYLPYELLVQNIRECSWWIYYVGVVMIPLSLVANDPQRGRKCKMPWLLMGESICQNTNWFYMGLNIERLNCFFRPDEEKFFWTARKPGSPPPV